MKVSHVTCDRCRESLTMNLDNLDVPYSWTELKHQGVYSHLCPSYSAEFQKWRNQAVTSEGTKLPELQTHTEPWGSVVVTKPPECRPSADAQCYFSAPWLRCIRCDSILKQNGPVFMYCDKCELCVDPAKRRPEGSESRKVNQ